MKVFNLSYENVKIDTPPNETIIYLDPPYKGTTTKNYDGVNDFQNLDYDKLYQWCHEMAQKGYSVFMSEYSCDSPYAEEIWQKEKQIKYSATKSRENDVRIERLYLWH
jgi:site-specific DNA-adenine methylase